MGQREQALATFMLNAAGITPEELEVLRTRRAWPGRIAAAHTIPRELRAFNNYEAERPLFVISSGVRPERRCY